jgi:hypothetical protein
MAFIGVVMKISTFYISISSVFIIIFVVFNLSYMKFILIFLTFSFNFIFQIWARGDVNIFEKIDRDNIRLSNNTYQFLSSLGVVAFVILISNLAS